MFDSWLMAELSTVKKQKGEAENSAEKTQHLAFHLNSAFDCISVTFDVFVDDFLLETFHFHVAFLFLQKKTRQVK